VITVPNAAFADMEIINWARCDHMLIQTTIGLRYETTLEQLRYVLAKLREMFVAHPKIGNDTVRVRFVGYGSSSLDIEIRVYALTRDWSEFYAIQEDVFLRVGEIVDDAGTSFAFPSQTLYLGHDVGLDAERIDKASRQVQSWRRTGQLPFPHMARSRREQLADTLDYPPRGSPDARHPEIHDTEEAEPLSTETENTTQLLGREHRQNPNGSGSKPSSSDQAGYRTKVTTRVS
jgi:MscS family membrane protein